VAAIMLRPDLKTSGGEIHDILLNGRYAGNMTLVYRERDRIGGAVQLDRTTMSEEDKEEVVAFVRNYIQDLIMAVRAVDCDVIVTNSPYDHIIATNRDEAGHLKELDDAESVDGANRFGLDDDPTIGDEDSDTQDRIEMKRYELVIVGESRNKIEYHVYDEHMDWQAEALFTIRGTDCSGEIHFVHAPTEDEIEAVADLIVSDFDENEIDSFDIRVLHDGVELERIELTHEDLIDDDETPSFAFGADENDFTVTLARDDGDMLTYEIYSQSRGGLPIGSATVDIENRQLSGFIDFRDPCTEEEREIIATLLMRELDKEKDYQTLNLSVMHGNEKIDEMLFESENVH